MIGNAILSVVFIALCFYVIYHYLHSENEDAEESDKNEYEINLDYMTEETSAALARTLRQSFNDGNLSRRELEQKQKMRSALSAAVTKAGYGDTDSKKIVIGHIRQLLVEPKYDIEGNINKLIPFNHPERIDISTKTNIILYLYEKNYWVEALDELFTEFHLMDAVEDKNGVVRHVVTKEKMNEVFQEVFRGNSSLGNVTLTMEDKIKIVAQRIFGRLIGLSAVDLLYGLSVDEIDVGNYGIPKNSFAIKADRKNLPYSYESVGILVHGLNIHLECLGFESQDDMVRVCKNIYNYDPPYQLSQEKGAVIATTSTGGRIVVYRPPFSDSWGFNLRRFDTTPSLKMMLLLRDLDHVIPIVIIKWVMRGLLNTLVTGQQATGKTTLLKSMLWYSPRQYNLRIQEKQMEMNLRYAYPDRNIVSFQETATLSSQDGINIQKKTNGGINVIGEIAEAAQAAFFIQTTNVGSYQGIGSHHGTTTDSAIAAIANNVMEPSVGLYQNEKNAIAAVAKALNIDIHMENDKGVRYNAYINEVIPTSEEPYPSESMGVDVTDLLSCDQGERLGNIANADASAYMKKITSAKPYKIHALVKWEPDFDENGKKTGGRYVLLDTFSDYMTAQIKKHLSLDEEAVFDHDMDMLRRYQSGERTGEVGHWAEQSLAS